MTNLAEQIAREYEREHKENRRAINPGDIPLSYEAITPEWLTHILCNRHPHAKVVSYQLDLPDEGGTNRRRIFITYNEEGTAAGLPPSVFCKASHQLATRQILASVGFIQGEVTFYNDYRPLLDIATPRCLLATFDPASFNSIIMFDDAVREGADFCLHTTEISRQQVENQLALLAKLHARFHESPELKRCTLPGFEQVFDNFDKFLGMEKYCNGGFLEAEETIPAQLYRRHAEIWPATLQSVEMHTKLPRTLAHNDPHLRNWYIAADGQMVLCDWQNFGGAHWARDVVYTISSSLSADNRRAWEMELLKFYLDRFAEGGGPKVAFADAHKYYRQHLFSTLAWWTSTLIVATTQPRDAILAIIGRIATTIDDLDGLHSFS